MVSLPRRRRRTPVRSARGPAVAAVLSVLLVGACGGAPDAPVPPLATGSTPPAAPASAAPAPAPPPGPDPCLLRAADGLGDARYGQLVMAGLAAGGPGSALPGGVGGAVVMQGHGVPAGTVAATTAAAQQASTRAGVGLLVATDQEGGKVQQLNGPGFDPVPPPIAQGPPDRVRDRARAWGTQLRRAGVTVDLAPVADVVDPALGPANATDGRFGRHYGTDPATAGAGAAAVVEGLDGAGVAATLKHFPGLGGVRPNTDFARDVVDPRLGADAPGLDAFRAGLRADAPLVMVSSASYPRLDPHNPAVFSPAILGDLLRGRLGFGGVIVSDDVGVAAAVADVPVPDRAVRFVAAGGDLVLDVAPADAEPMIRALSTRAAADPAFRARADDAVDHVLQLKRRQGLLRCG